MCQAPVPWHKRSMGMADTTLMQLAAADPAHPKVALVPHMGACGWCVMLGSRGFTNTEKAMDNMCHDGCKCTTVIDFDRDNPALDGYDPDAMYQLYREACTDEDMRQWRAEWEAMSAEERAKYVRRTRDRTGAVKERPGDWSTYVRNRTAQNMGKLMRDPDFTGGHEELAAWLPRQRAALGTASAVKFNGDLEGPNISGFKISKGQVLETRKYLSGEYGTPEPYTFDEADNGRCNPHYGEPGYGSNCTITAAVYELRRKGYNVEALPRFDDDKLMEAIALNPLSIWFDSKTGKPLRYDDLMGYSPDDVIKLFDSRIVQDERYTLAFSRVKTGGHVVSVERDAQGDLFIYDSQNNTICRQGQMLDYLRDTSRIAVFARVDDAIIDVDKASRVMRLAFDVTKA